MCASQPKAPKAPKFKDPKLKDPKYQKVANKLGIKKFNSANDIYKVEKFIAQKQQAKFQSQLAATEKANAASQAAQLAQAEAQFAEMNKLQEAQFQQSMAAQEQALQAQLAAQAELQQKAEEANLKAQVPQFTTSPSSARRVKSRKTSKALAKQAARGVSQLRIPLSINSGSSSPVKLNIGA